MEKFAQLVRDELVHKELPRCRGCVQAELAAIIHMAGSIHLSGNERFSLSIETEGAGVVRRIIKLLKYSANLQAEVRVANYERLGRRRRYLLYLPMQPGLSELLYKVGVMTRERNLETDIPAELVKAECCRAAYLRGAFLTRGSISDPQKTTYHMELVTHNEEFANNLAYLMTLLGLKARVALRKGHYMVYLKDSDALARFLILISADQAVLKLEEVRVVKGLRGEVNRKVNCETANLEKAVAAAWEQVELINKLMAAGVFKKLPENLRETARLRLEYPEASLKELGEYHLPPLSKSAVNHRLRQIKEFAKKFF